jgi:adenylate kinase
MKNSNNSMVIILLGPPGSGKGTQASLLSQKFNLYYLETSKLLEEAFKKEKKENFIVEEGKKYYFKDEKKLWEEGKLCDPPFVTHLILRKIKELFKEKRNLVLAGSPRTVYEGERVMPVLEKLFGKENIQIFFLKIKKEQSIFRNSNRRICELLRHPIFYLKENKNLKFCPLDGSKLLKRGKLDKAETIKVRLKEFEERTLPLLKFLKERNYKIEEIDGSPPPAKVFEKILEKIK